MKRCLSLLAGILLLVSALIQPMAALAYSGSQSASYADQWYNSYNPNYPDLESILGTGGDCTNFVSQAIHAGGYAFEGDGGTTTDDANWYCDGPYDGAYGSKYWDYSNAWSCIPNLRDFLLNYYPYGGTDQGVTNDATQQFATGNGTTGDLVAYDWTGSGTWDHAALLVGVGTDPTSDYYGSLVDAHSNSHYHALWTLLPYNSQWQTTRYDVIHIN